MKKLIIFFIFSLIAGCSQGGYTNTSINKKIMSISINLSKSTIAKGLSQQYIATAIYSDGTSSPITSNITWVSSNLSVATINDTGLATVLESSGTTEITAIYQNIISKSAILIATTRPYLLASTPAISTNVWPIESISLTFSEAIESETVNSTSIELIESGQTTNLVSNCNGSSTSYTCYLSTPSSGLAGGIYNLKISTAVKSLNSNQPLLESNIAFTIIRFISTTAGWYHTCAIASNGSEYCWGDNESGQLGNSNNDASSIPVKVYNSSVLSGLNLITTSAGSFHTCAIANNGREYCWGYNTYGQLGNGDTNNSNIPIAVDVGGVLNGLTLTATAAGYANTCAIASNGREYCWGVILLGNWEMVIILIVIFQRQ